MKIISYALCLAAVALVAVEATPGSVGSHFRARMIRDKNLLQRRGDPSSQACSDAKNAAYARMTELNSAIQGYTHPSLTQVRDFQAAIFEANSHHDETHYDKIKSTYSSAITALESAGIQGQPVRDKTVPMMEAVNKAADACGP